MYMRWIFLINFLFVFQIEAKYDLDLCKEFRFDSEETKYFELKSLKNEPSIDGEDYALNLKFYALAGDIRISFTDQPNDPTEVFQIPFVLTARLNDVTPLNIKVYRTGRMHINLIKNILIENPTRFNYIGFRQEALTRLFYNCETPVPKTYTGQLQNDLSKNYNAAINTAMNIMVSVDLNSAFFDEPKTFMISRSRLRMTWTDSQIVWSEPQYGGVNQFHLRNTDDKDQIWVPRIHMLNSGDEWIPSFLLDAIVYSNGTVVAESNEKVFITLCSINFESKTVNCKVQIQIDRFANITLGSLNNNLQNMFSNRTANHGWYVKKADAKLNSKTSISKGSATVLSIEIIFEVQSDE